MRVAIALLRRLLPILLLLALVPLAPVATTRATGATTWTVSTTNDTATPAAAHCTGTACPTLRDALVAAHSGDTISLAGLSGTLVSTGTPLTITTSLTITGPAPTGAMGSSGATSTALTVKGNQMNPTFWIVGTGLAVTISNLTISNGGCTYKPVAAAGGLMAGGGIEVTAALTRTIALTLTNTSVFNNPGSGAPNPCTWGGGISMDISHGGNGTLTLIHSTVQLNSATNGGGILVYGASSTTSGTANVTLQSSIVNTNTNTAGSGAGIDIDGFATATLALSGTTVTNNRAQTNAGVYVRGGPATLSITNSQISNNISNDSYNSDRNAVVFGGGLWADATTYALTLANTSFVGNCGWSTLAENIAQTQPDIYAPSQSIVVDFPVESCPTAVVANGT